MFREETHSGKPQREVKPWGDTKEIVDREHVLTDITSDFMEDENSDVFVQQRMDRRERNRASARGCRLRKKARIEKLGAENTELKMINKAQEHEIERLRLTVKLLNQQLDMVIPKNEQKTEELISWL